MREEIKFEEKDEIGEATLDVISEADKFNQWMYKTIMPFCKGKILEIGSGIGNISDFFIRDNFEIMLTDIRKEYYSKLNIRFGNFPSFSGAEMMNLADSGFEEKYRKHIGRYDTVFALNVVEHIHDDAMAIINCNKLLKEGGKLIILVPSYQILFNKFDSELGHYRRYTKSSLLPLFLNANFEIVHKQYFNFTGILGWYVSGGLLKKDSIPGNQMKMYNRLVPLFKIIDKLILNVAGLSTIMVGRKK